MNSTRLTRRGRIVTAVCVLGVLMSVIGGGRALNAVVLSGAVAIVAGYLQVARASRPRVRRSGISPGFVGERRDVSLSFGDGDGRGSPSSTFVARVFDATDDGLSGSADGVRTTVGAEPATYTVAYAARGERRFGPVRIEPTDVFGLFTRTFVVDDHETVLAYPERHPIPSRFRGELFGEEMLGRRRRREEFDRVREYARGDSLRDIHWPTTAKHDELIVKEFASDAPERRATVAGRTVDTTDDEAADVLASATVSLALALLADGVSVDVRLPDGAVAADPEPSGRRDILALTARTGPGTSAGEFEADVRIVADATDARIHADGGTVQFSELRAEAAEEPDSAVTTATTGSAEDADADGPADPGEVPSPTTIMNGGTSK